MQLGVTHPGGPDADPHLAGRRGTLGDVVEDEGTVRTNVTHGAHGSASVLTRKEE
jgi:hypothetical protein